MAVGVEDALLLAMADDEDEDELFNDEDTEVGLMLLAELDIVSAWTLELVGDGVSDVFGAAVFVGEADVVGSDSPSPTKSHDPQMYPGPREPAKYVKRLVVRSIPPYGQPVHCASNKQTEVQSMFVQAMYTRGLKLPHY